ncbi:hypothetical protein [Streptomyces sp. NRRL WC-3742]|nr:hypothetical protein [Streptomyces sp. NRRL WC-3742]
MNPAIPLVGRLLSPSRLRLDEPQGHMDAARGTRLIWEAPTGP